MSICYDVCIHFIGCVWENDEPKERQKAMNRKIWKALGIAVCMLALAAPRAMAETHVHMVTADTNFAEVVKTINASKDEDENVIELYDDITLAGNYTLTRNTTIKSKDKDKDKDKDRKISINGSNAGITVTGEGTVLNLGEKGYDKKLTIDGDTRAAFITVSGGATAYMYENVTLQNRKFSGNSSVHVDGEKSVFNLCGGVIRDCEEGLGSYAGAVRVDNQATFNMSSGEIRNCEGGKSGGVHVSNATFVMSGGTINGCSADTGGGLCAENSTVTIKNGTISGCTAGAGGGLYADNSTINITGGIISGCEGRWGGGLYAKNSPKITITGGTISGCKASLGAGGGLYVNGSTITINNGTISGCTAIGDGGGLYAKNSSAITITGGTISGCEGGLGGGLYAEDSSTHSSTVTISDVTISGCKAGAGGGLYVVGLTLNIEGGTISECFVSDSGKGGGLFADQSTLTISGGRIENNKAAYGGGVALRDSKVKKEDPITNWTVVGNKAYKTDTGSGYIGGGIYLESGSMDVSNGSNKIYNNTADGHGADICLTDDTSSIKLPIAANMYHDSSINIDNWYKDDNPRHKPSESGEVVEANKWLNGGLSLVASYKADPVYIKIDANGGVGGSSSQEVQKGTTVTLEAPTKEGHLFKGWKDEKGNSYPAGEDGKVNITVNENMKLTAVWEARTFTVTYVLLNGKTRTETVNYGQTVTLGEEPRTGYTFVGWKDGENVYRAGETITVTEDKTLTAVWKPRTFTVTYVLLNGETRTQTVDYGQTVTLGEEPRTGYTFVGWKDGEKMYHAGETITVTENMTLTAEWKKLPSAENLPKTGDESPVLLWGAALAVSAAACFVLRRKK